MDFDVRSAMLLSSLFIGMMSIVLFFLRSSFPSTIRGISEWASATTILFIAIALFGLRDMLPDFLTLVVANLLVMVGLCLLFFGSQRHFGLAVSVRNWTIFGMIARCFAAFQSADRHIGITDCFDPVDCMPFGFAVKRREKFVENAQQMRRADPPREFGKADKVGKDNADLAVRIGNCGFAALDSPHDFAWQHRIEQFINPPARRVERFIGSVLTPRGIFAQPR